MPFEVQDHYFHRAKKEHFLARSVYKLEEIQKRHRLLRPGDRVLDLGAAPGSWMQYAAQVVGPRGRVVGVDMKPFGAGLPENALGIAGDVTDAAFMAELASTHGPFDVVLSDMAPATSGIRVADSARSALLFEAALAVARAVLRPGGHFCAKLFQGAEFHELLSEVKKSFEWTKIMRPEAVRKTSREVYVLAMRLRRAPESQHQGG